MNAKSMLLPVIYIVAPLVVAKATGWMVPLHAAEAVLGVVSMMDDVTTGQPYRGSAAVVLLAYPVLSPLLMVWMRRNSSGELHGTRAGLVGLAVGCAFFAALILALMVFGSADSSGTSPRKAEAIFSMMRNGFVSASLFYGIAIGVSAAFLWIALFILNATLRRK